MKEPGKKEEAGVALCADLFCQHKGAVVVPCIIWISPSPYTAHPTAGFLFQAFIL